jgi:hypothetical protein
VILNSAIVEDTAIQNGLGFSPVARFPIAKPKVER